MSIFKDYYEQHHKPRKPRTKYKSFLVRDSNEYSTVYFVIKLEEEKYWQEAKEYMWKKREEDNSYNYRDDRDIMEEYWQNNNINYNIVNLPNNELFL
jgi:hypothetical protein